MINEAKTQTPKAIALTTVLDHHMEGEYAEETFGKCRESKCTKKNQRKDVDKDDHVVTLKLPPLLLRPLAWLFGFS